MYIEVKATVESPNVRHKIDGTPIPNRGIVESYTVSNPLHDSSNKNALRAASTSSSGARGSVTNNVSDLGPVNRASVSTSGANGRENVAAKYRPMTQDDPNENAKVALERENNRFIGDQRQEQLRRLEQQDANLALLGTAVDKVGELAVDINTELKTQTKLLDALSDDIDDAQERLNTVMASLTKMLKSKDGCEIYVIVVLTIILIILSEYLYCCKFRF